MYLSGNNIKSSQMNNKTVKALSDTTRLKILGLLAEEPLTNTELYNKLKNEGIAYRESIFKSLKKLKEAGLIKRTYQEKVGFKYSLSFKELKIGSKLKLSSA